MQFPVINVYFGMNVGSIMKEVVQMKLSEKTLNIFATIKTINADLKLFQYIDETVIDEYYNAMYSERTLSALAENSTVETIARLINGMFHTKWDNLIDGYTTAIEKLLTFGTNDSYTETRKNESSGTDTTINTISAYNDENFSNNNKSDTTSTNNEDETITHTTNRSSARNVNIVWNYLLRTNVIYNIIEDVNSIVTLSIYEGSI